MHRDEIQPYWHISIYAVHTKLQCFIMYGNEIQTFNILHTIRKKLFAKNLQNILFFLMAVHDSIQELLSTQTMLQHWHALLILKMICCIVWHLFLADTTGILNI